VLDGEVEAHDGESLLIRVSDPADLNRRLVEAGVRVTELAPERLALEDIVLAATSAGSDRMDRADHVNRVDNIDRPDPPSAGSGRTERLELP
jgi:hypothetical protein